MCYVLDYLQLLFSSKNTREVLFLQYVKKFMSILQEQAAHCFTLIGLIHTLLLYTRLILSEII